MILLLLVAGALIYWMWRRGEFKALTMNDMIAGATSLVGLYTLLRGEWAVGPVLIGAALTYFGRRRVFGRSRPAAMRADEACRVLDVAPGADAATIRNAHRRLVAKVHPDQGGSAELAARVNAARDALLSELDRRPRG